MLVGRAVGDGAREVRVCVCDGKEVVEWLVGTSENNKFPLRSEDRDASVSGSFTGNGASGTVSLADGRTARFSAKEPSGQSGFYSLDIKPDGQITGRSGSGGSLSARVDE